MKNWMHIENSAKGFVNDLSRYIENREDNCEIYLPNLRETKALYLFSDYSGSKKQQLITYSILVLDEESYKSFISVQRKFWEVYSLDKRIIDYKGLNDVCKRNALIPFLQLCNNLNGLILSVIFNKNTKSIFRDDKPEYLEKQIDIWKNKYAKEKFLRLRELILLAVSGLGGKLRNILWVTDNDDIVANSLYLAAANTIMRETLVKYLDFGVENFEIKTLDNDSLDRNFEKLCSLPDLIAGTLVDYVGDYYKMSLIPKQEGIVGSIPHEKDKLYDITDWLMKDEEKSKLKKVNIFMEEAEDGGLNIKTLKFPYLF
jgi:hypothetical protein